MFTLLEVPGIGGGRKAAKGTGLENDAHLIKVAINEFVLLM